MEVKHQLSHQLRQLRLSGVMETLEARNRQAIDEKWSFMEFLSRLLEDEDGTARPEAAQSAPAPKRPQCHQNH